MGCASSSAASAAGTEAAKGVKFDDNNPKEVKQENRTNSDKMISREYKEGDAKLSEKVEEILTKFFDAIDGTHPARSHCASLPRPPAELSESRAASSCAAADKNGEITKDEAIKFWGKNFAKVNANAMFNEVDADSSDSVTKEEFKKFFANVLAHGVSACPMWTGRPSRGPLAADTCLSAHLLRDPWVLFSTVFGGGPRRGGRDDVRGICARRPCDLLPSARRHAADQGLLPRPSTPPAVAAMRSCLALSHRPHALLPLRSGWIVGRLRRRAHDVICHDKRLRQHATCVGGEERGGREIQAQTEASARMSICDPCDVALCRERVLCTTWGSLRVLFVWVTRLWGMHRVCGKPMTIVVLNARRFLVFVSSVSTREISAHIRKSP